MVEKIGKLGSRHQMRKGVGAGASRDPGGVENHRIGGSTL